MAEMEEATDVGCLADLSNSLLKIVEVTVRWDIKDGEIYSCVLEPTK